MIVSPRPEGLVVVRQVDHQDQCALMAAAWGNDRFLRPRPWGPIAAAAAWHDEGWRAWEARPQVGDDGRPVDFVDIDRTAHVALYRDGIATCVRRDPATGLLVSLHGRGLYEKRLGIDGPIPDRGERPPAVQAYLQEQDRLEQDLRARLHPDPEWEWAAYRLLQAFDLLSLYLVWRAHPAGRPGTLARVPRRPGDEGVDIALRPLGPREVGLDPYPFATPEVSLEVAARIIPDRPYDGPDDLARTHAGARPVRLRYVARPG